MKAITILAIIVIIAALGAVTSLIPMHQSALADAQGQGSSYSNFNAYNQGTSNAYQHTPVNQPCATQC